LTWLAHGDEQVSGHWPVRVSAATVARSTHLIPALPTGAADRGSAGLRKDWDAVKAGLSMV
jgi:hypothetical protein